MIFFDRRDGARQLAAKLSDYKGKHAIVIGLARGGVVTADEVATHLALPLELCVVRKIGAPENPELAIGAVTEQGHVSLNREIIAANDVSDTYIDRTRQEKIQEAKERATRYRGERKPQTLAGAIVILVDDGIATGATMRAALLEAHAQKPQGVVVAAPVIAADTVTLFEQETEAVVAVHVPEYFGAVGQFYMHFNEVSDDEVMAIYTQHH